MAYLCTLVMLENIDAEGLRRYPVGEWPILDKDSGKVLVDGKGRRSYATDIAFGPSLGVNVLMAYLPVELAVVGNEFHLEYFCEHYTVRIEAVGYSALLDPDNERPRS